MPLKKPKVVLLDLDNTMVTSSIPRINYWNAVTTRYESSLSPVEPEVLSAAIIRWGDYFWGNNGRNMKWRLYLRDARRKIVELAFNDLKIGDIELANRIADDFSDLREKGDNMSSLVPGSIETVRNLRKKGISLALLTNGSSKCQRSKLERFNLTPLFDHILIEGELGYGKPDLRIYQDALERLSAKREETWIIGDNPLWDVMAPQKLGIRGVWITNNNRNEPENFCPFLTIRSFPDILKYVK